MHSGARPWLPSWQLQMRLQDGLLLPHDLQGRPQPILQRKPVGRRVRKNPRGKSRLQYSNLGCTILFALQKWSWLSAMIILVVAYWEQGQGKKFSESEWFSHCAYWFDFNCFTLEREYITTYHQRAMFTLQMAILLSSIVIEQTIFLKLPFVNIPCYTDCIPTQAT